MGACGSVLRQCQKTKPRRPLPPSRCQYHHQLGTKQSLKGLSGALEASGSLAALAFHSPTPPFRLLRSRKTISVENSQHISHEVYLHSGYFSCEVCAIVCYQYLHERISAYLCYLPVILNGNYIKIFIILTSQVVSNILAQFCGPRPKSHSMSIFCSAFIPVSVTNK